MHYLAEAGFEPPVLPYHPRGFFHEYGPCYVEIAEQGVGGSDSPQRWLSAGRIQITGLRTDPLSLEIKDGLYRTATATGTAFTGGETIGVTAEGDPTGVPAFDVAITAPRPFELQTQLPAEVPLDQDLTLSWTVSEIPLGTVEVGFSEPEPPTKRHLRCVWSEA